MPIVLFHDSCPSGDITGQVLQLVVSYLTDLSMLAVPASNPLYRVYEWALPCEVDLYIQRIGRQPDAPVELIVAFAEDNPAEVVGFLLYLPVKSHPEACGINYMAVKKSHRRRGIGREMMERAIARYPHVELTCSVAKVPYYEKMGFQVLDSHHCQIVMNTRCESTPGMMGICDVEAIYRSPQVQQIQSQLLQRWGLKEIQNAQKQLERHAEHMTQKAMAFAQGRLAK